MTGPLEVTVKLTGMMANTERANAIKNEELVKSIEMILMWLWRKVVEKTPKTTSYLASSIKAGSITGTGGNVQGAVGTPVAYALPVEHGRKPGKMPNIDAIKMWMKSKLGTDDDQAAYRIARSIMMKGIPEVKMFQDTLDEEETMINRTLDQAFERIKVRWADVTQ